MRPLFTTLRAAGRGSGGISPPAHPACTIIIDLDETLLYRYVIPLDVYDHSVTLYMAACGSCEMFGMAHA